MFDLEKAVAAWSEAVYAGRCGSGASVAELSDHLHCEIERARAEGLSQEQAFAAAVAKLGSAEQLAAEHAKNRAPILGTLAAGCEVVARHERADLRSGRWRFLLAHGFLWAAVILGSSLLLGKSAVPAPLSVMLIGVLVPSWWASEQLLRRALQRWPAGGG